MRIVVTWSSGFIWYWVSRRLIQLGHEVIGVDNENGYYGYLLKACRRSELEMLGNFKFHNIDIEEAKADIFEGADVVIHLAWQAGVRYSIENPYEYIRSNIVGFHNIIHLAMEAGSKFIYASSSSVYWNRTRTDRPESLYAATKKSDELIAYSYSRIYWMSTIGLRFYTVYGPLWRPDMAIFKFADRIIRWEEIDIYNYGEMERDFTYIEDIVEGIIAAIDYECKYDVFNLWNSNPIKLGYLVELLEEEFWLEAKKNYMPLQKWDVLKTAANIKHTKQRLWWSPKTCIEDWIKKFWEWYKHKRLNVNRKNFYFTLEK